jgi:hypothetical protein
MAQQAADDLKGHIFVDETHPNGVSELMRREVVEMLMAISNLALQRPFVELPAKSRLEVGLRWRGRGREKIGTRFSPSCSDFLLLDLDCSNHLILNQGNDQLSMGFALIEAQVPLVFVICNQTIHGELAQFTNAQADLEQNGNHP